MISRCKALPGVKSKASSVHASDKIAELRRALFFKGGDALLGFVGIVIETDGLQAQCRDTPLVLGIRIEGTLCDRQRRGAALHDLITPALYLFIQLLMRYHAIDEPHPQRLFGRITPAHIPHLACPLLANDTGQVGAAESRDPPSPSWGQPDRISPFQRRW